MIFHLPTTFFPVVHHISPTRGNILTWPLGDLSVVHKTSVQSNWWVPGEINHRCIIHTFISVWNIVMLIQEKLMVIMFLKISYISRLFPCKTKGLKQQGDIESTVVPDFVAWFLPRVENDTGFKEILTPKILHFRHLTEGQSLFAEVLQDTKWQQKETTALL